MPAGPALNSLDRATDPWGLAVPAERGRRQQRGCQGEGMPPRRGRGSSDFECVLGGWISGGPLGTLPWAGCMVAGKLFQLVLGAGGPGFGQFGIRRGIWYG